MSKKPVKTRAERLEEKPGIALKVLDNIRVHGMSLRKAAMDAGISAATFNCWCNDDVELAKQYALARTAMIDKMADEILEIADEKVIPTGDGKLDNAMIQKQRLQVEARKWILSKLAPKKFGDKLELSGDAENPLAIERIERVIVNGKNPAIKDS